MSNYSLSTITGEGRGIVHCTFDVSSDGDIEDLEVYADKHLITDFLTLEQIEELECECYDSYCREAKEHNDDMRIDRYISAREYRECNA